MIFYKIGCNFDLRLIDSIYNLNSLNKHSKITEFYGSDRHHAFLTARPDFRLPYISNKRFLAYIKRCAEAGLSFNYTLNTPYPGTKRELVSKKRRILDHICFLEDAGVRSITVSNPLLAEFVREASHHIGLEVSTISHIDSITQIKLWCDVYGITSVCCNLLKNRSIEFLRRAARYCNQHRIALSLITNEFCILAGGTGKKAYGSPCIYRDSCYLCHAGNKSKEDDDIFDHYPMGRCIASRRNKSDWLKAFFIRPEDIPRYQTIGISWFKITGRTGSTEYILKIAEAYLTNCWHGNLLALWKPLETILSEEHETTFRHPIYIDNKHLNGFIDFWFNNPSHDCANEICGETCTYCNDFLARSSPYS